MIATTLPKPSLLDAAQILVAMFEGKSLTAYKDTGGVWTIGVGHTGPVHGQPITAGDAITEQECAQLFQADLGPVLAQVQSYTTNVQAGGALVSFGFNCGATALAHVISGNAKITQFTHDRSGKIVDGLVKRRAMEQLLIDLS